MAKADLANANALVKIIFANLGMMNFGTKSEAPGMEGLGSLT